MRGSQLKPPQIIEPPRIILALKFHKSLKFHKFMEVPQIGGIKRSTQNNPMKLFITLLIVIAVFLIVARAEDEVEETTDETWMESLDKIKKKLPMLKQCCVENHETIEGCFNHYASGEDDDGKYMVKEDFSNLLTECEEAEIDEDIADQVSNDLFRFFGVEQLRWGHLIVQWFRYVVMGYLFEDAN